MIFCKYCYFYKRVNAESFCYYPANIITEEKPNWYDLDVITKFKLAPWLKNVNNNCTDYIIKERG